MKNIQIPEKLFYDLVRYFIIGQEDVRSEIRRELEKKVDAMVMREFYTKYKTAPSEAEREKARKEYLDRKGVPESFRWSSSLENHDGSVAHTRKRRPGELSL